MASDILQDLAVPGDQVNIALDATGRSHLESISFNIIDTHTSVKTRTVPPSMIESTFVKEARYKTYFHTV